MRTYFIIEHPTLGTFTGDYTDTGRPRFSWSGQRSDAERARRFASVADAVHARASFPERIRDRCDVRCNRDGERGTMRDPWPVVA